MAKIDTLLTVILLAAMMISMSGKSESSTTARLQSEAVTGTAAPTAAATGTAAPTAAATGTAAPTAAATGTAAPTAAATGTAAPTGAQATGSAAPTAAATGTAAPTAMATGTAAPTVMATGTAAPTAMATGTAAPTAMATGTAAPTAAATGTAAPTAAATGTAAPTAMATGTAAPTAAATGTAAPTAAATGTAAPTGAQATGTAAPSAAATGTAAPTTAATGTATPTTAPTAAATGTAAPTAAATGTAAPTTAPTAAPTTVTTISTTTRVSVCSSDFCNNFGTCSVVNGQATCTCSAGYDGTLCDSFIRSYEVTLASNDESGVLMEFNPTTYGSDTPERRVLESRMCSGTRDALRKSSFPAFSQMVVFTCSLLRCYRGSLMTDISIRITFPPNTTAAPQPDNLLSALRNGITASNATFTNGSRASAKYGNACGTNATSPCSAYGTCRSSSGIYSCICNSGYADANSANPGTNCTQMCTSTSCPGANQVCVQRVGQQSQCQCSVGYTGSDCTSQHLSPAIIGLIVACCVLFVLAALGILLYCLLRRKTIAGEPVQKETTLVGDAFMMEEVVKWKAVPDSAKSGPSSSRYRTYPDQSDTQYLRPDDPARRSGHSTGHSSLHRAEVTDREVLFAAATQSQQRTVLPRSENPYQQEASSDGRQYF